MSEANPEEKNLRAGKRTLMYVLCYANLSDDKITEKDGFAEVPLVYFCAHGSGLKNFLKIKTLIRNFRNALRWKVIFFAIHSAGNMALRLISQHLCRLKFYPCRGKFFPSSPDKFFFL